MNDHGFALKILKSCPKNTFNSILLAGCWNLIDQTGTDVFDFCKNNNIETQNAGIFASGMLVGGKNYKYSSNIPENI